jgi:hypothetical protein
MNREEIISANPIVDFVRDRGHELKRAGENFVTSACPVGPHKKQGHTPVTTLSQKRVVVLSRSQSRRLGDRLGDA